MSEEEPRYTLREAQEELRRQDCANYGHVPSTVIRDGSGLAVAAFCDCGSVRFVPDLDLAAAPFADRLAAHSRAAAEAKFGVGGETSR